MTGRLLALLCLSLIGTARAGEPHFDFVDRLRNAGMADLAGDYLKALPARDIPGVADRLPLEQAKTLVALAEAEEDDRKRDDKLTAAGVAFRAFLDRKPAPRVAADTRLELARLLVRQGKYRVIASRRLENKSEKQDALARARASFQTAASEIEAAEAALKGERSRAEGPDRDSLTRRINELSFEKGLLLINKALTYGDATAEQLRLRNADILNAKKLFLDVAELDENDPLSLRAFVEVGRCWTELDNVGEARKIFEAVAKSAGAGSSEASRVARFYELQLMDKDNNNKNRLSDVIRGCEEWLSRYRAFARTPEGQGVQFLLATNLIQQAQPGIRAQKSGPTTVDGTARQMLTRSEKLLKNLASEDSEYSRKAANLRSELLVLLMAERAAGGLARLNNFEECFLTAQVEFYQWGKASGPETDRKKADHLRNAILALQRGLSLATRSDDAKDVFTARVMLSYLHLLNGDPYSAAILGEHLAMSNLGSPRGVKAAVYALSAYATILGETRNRNGSPEEIDADARRLRSLADRVLRNPSWKEEPETDAARFQLGNLFMEAAQYRDAYQMYADIRESFPAFATARYRQGAAAQLLQAKDQPGSADDKRKVLLDAIGELEKVSPPTPGSSSDTVIASFQAKLQLAQLLMLAGEDEKNYGRVEALGTRLREFIRTSFDKNDPAFQQLETEADRIEVAGKTGRAYLLINGGKYDDAVKQLEPVVASVGKWADSLKGPTAGEPWVQSFAATLREAIALHTRAHILEGRVDEAKKDIARMKSLAPADRPQVVFDQLLRVVLDLKRDLDKFKKANDAERQRKLEDGMIGFLDELASPADIGADVRVFLAQGYAAIDRHDKAAELLASVKPPSGEDEAETRTYRFARLALAREYRLGKKFDEAKNTLREIMGTPARKGWGHDSFEVRKEAIQVLEDEGQFAAAVRMAIDEQNKLLKPAQEFASKSERVKALRNAARSKPADDPEAVKLRAEADLLETDVQRLAPLRERFFEYYFLEVRSIFKNAQKSEEAKRFESYARLANRIVKLEQGQPDLGGDTIRRQFIELIEEDPEFKSRYTAAGGRALQEQQRP